jgi:nitrogen fixation protein NifU and related proteins
MSDARDLYQAVIVAHDRAPHNCGPLPDATHQASADNPLCGDQVTVRLVLSPAGTVATIRFEARGCALTRAAASLMTDAVLGLSPPAIRALSDRFSAFLRPASSDAGADLGDLTAFLGVRAFRSRHACATLPFRALVSALG